MPARSWEARSEKKMESIAWHSQGPLFVGVGDTKLLSRFTTPMSANWLRSATEVHVTALASCARVVPFRSLMHRLGGH